MIVQLILVVGLSHSNVGTDSNELFVSESLPARLIQHSTHLALQQIIRSGQKIIIRKMIRYGRQIIRDEARKLDQCLWAI